MALEEKRKLLQTCCKARLWAHKPSWLWWWLWCLLYLTLMKTLQEKNPWAIITMRSIL